MDKLTVVKQESKTDMLPNNAMGPLPDSLPPTLCPWPLEKGGRKGLPCNEKAFDGKVYCSAHQIVIARRDVKEGKVETINESVRCSDAIPLIPITHTPEADMEILAKIREVDTQERILIPAQSQQGFQHNMQQYADAYMMKDLISIVKNFSIALANLTEIVKK